MANIYKEQLAEQQKKQQELKLASRKKKITIISASIAAVLAIIILVFALVPLKPYNSFSENGFIAPNHYEVHKGEQYENWTPNESRELYDGVQTNLFKTRFSILRGILEWKLSAKLTIEIEYDEDDETEIINKIKRSDIDALPTQAAEANILLVLYYTSVQKVKISGTEIAYNRAAIFVRDNGNKITKNQIIFYNTTEFSEEDYMTYHTYFNGNTEMLFHFLQDNTTR